MARCILRPQFSVFNEAGERKALTILKTEPVSALFEKALKVRWSMLLDARRMWSVCVCVDERRAEALTWSSVHARVQIPQEFGIEEADKDKYRLCRYNSHRKQYLDVFKDMVCALARVCV